jgi:prophage tail gpP-like protein
MPEQVGITIGGKQFDFWSTVTFTDAIDNHPTLSLVAPWEPERSAFRKLFRPFSYALVQATIGGQDVFTGTLMPVRPQRNADTSFTEIAAYSRAAKLTECDMPWDAIPFECNGLAFDEIAKHFCAPLVIGVDMAGQDPGPPFLRVKPRRRSKVKKDPKVSGGAGQETLTVEGNVQEFLADLARQRGFVLGSNAQGQLTPRRGISSSAENPLGRPVYSFEEGKQPLATIVPQFNEREWYSEITGLVPAKKGRPGSKFTMQNPFFSASERRTTSFQLDDTEAAYAPAAVEARMGRMIANCVQYVLSVPTWRDPRGALWKPNTIVTAKAASAMIYDEYEFLIRDVTLTMDENQESAQIGLVLPGSFGGSLPGALPWGE